jgi:hypothetical protein
VPINTSPNSSPKATKKTPVYHGGKPGKTNTPQKTVKVKQTTMPSPSKG